MSIIGWSLVSGVDRPTDRPIHCHYGAFMLEFNAGSSILKTFTWISKWWKVFSWTTERPLIACCCHCLLCFSHSIKMTYRIYLFFLTVRRRKTIKAISICLLSCLLEFSAVAFLTWTRRYEQTNCTGLVISKKKRFHWIHLKYHFDDIIVRYQLLVALQLNCASSVFGAFYLLKIWSISINYISNRIVSADSVVVRAHHMSAICV